jgi:hypothetical protein
MEASSAPKSNTKVTTCRPRAADSNVSMLQCGVQPNVSLSGLTIGLVPGLGVVSPGFGDKKRLKGKH